MSGPDATGRIAAHPLLLHGTLLVSGASVMVIEILGTRVLGPFYGLGVQVWAALITVTLVALALGYWAGGTLADRRPSPVLFHGVVVLAGLTTLLPHWLAGPVMEKVRHLGLEMGALASALVVFGPALFLLGTLTPFACRLHPGHASRTGSTVGRLYAVSTVGSVFGALAAGFVLIPMLPVSRIFQATSLALGVTGVVGLLVHHRRLAAAAAVLVVLAHLPGPPARKDRDDLLVVRDVQTFYNRIQTIDALGERWLFLDGLVHTHLTQASDMPIRCEYVRLADLVSALRPDAKRHLVIGCGGGAMVRLLAGVGKTFDVVDIDEEVMRAAREDFGAGIPGARFHVGDGRMFLRTDETWDAALLDVVSTEIMPEHLSTAEFLEELKASLTPGGVLLMNSVGTPGGRVLDSFGRTIRSVFEHVLGYTAHAQETTTNVVWLASDEPLVLPEETMYAYEDRVYATGDTGIVFRDDYNPVNAWNAKVGQELRRHLHRRFGRDVFEAR